MFRLLTVLLVSSQCYNIDGHTLAGPFFEKNLVGQMVVKLQNIIIITINQICKGVTN
jgi:hypothetical protein